MDSREKSGAEGILRGQIGGLSAYYRGFDREGVRGE